MNSDHPILVIIRGIPGSGKTTVARALKEQIGDDHVTLLDPDTIDFESEEYKRLVADLKSEGVDEKFYPFRFLRKQALDGIMQNKTIIWNQAFNDLNGFQITIGRLQEFATANGIHLPLLVVEVEVSYEVARERINQRTQAGGHNVPDDALKDYVKNYKSFAAHGYDTLTLNGENDAQQSAQAVLQRLSALRT